MHLYYWNIVIKYFVQIIYICNVLGQNGLLTEIPENAAVNIGETTIFKCRSNSSSDTLLWDYIQARSASRLFIYNGFGILETHILKYSILIDGHGRHDLVVSSTNISDAGYYRCWQSGSDNKYSAELTIFGKLQIVFYHLFLEQTKRFQ